jgi:hypothetical protein
MSGVAWLTKNGPTMRARNGTTASQRMPRMDEDPFYGENLPPAVAKIYLCLESFGIRSISYAYACLFMAQTGC